MRERAFVLNNTKDWLRSHWHGDSFSFGRVFLWLAVWNTFVAAINVTLWPRVYDLQALVYMKPLNLALPIISCLFLAACFRGMGARPVLKAFAVIGIIALVTFALWNYRSEAWLNQYGYHILN